MAVHIRAKRVTDPLDERVQARLRGEITTSYGSSGSEHGATGFDHLGFSGLVHAFFQFGNEGEDDDQGGGRGTSDGEDSDSEGGSGGGADMERAAEQRRKLREALDPKRKKDSIRSRIRLEVEVAVKAIGTMVPSESGFRRSVMARLRDKGYNAGICKVRWEANGGLTAGSYEYIDVVAEEGNRRYIVDLGFAAEFVIARATEEYDMVVAALPTVVVAKTEEVKAAVRIMADAVKQSLKNRGMSVPPWRKKRYMLAKWLGPYRRTVNPIPAALAVVGDVLCREVGFRTPGIGSVALPAATMW